MTADRKPTLSAIGKTLYSFEKGFAFFTLFLALVFGDTGSFSSTVGILAILASMGLYLNLLGTRGENPQIQMDQDSLRNLLTEPEYQTVSNPEEAFKFFTLLGVVVYSGSTSLLLFTLIFGGAFYYFISEYLDDLYKASFNKDYIDYRTNTPLWFPNKVVLYEPNLSKIKKGLNIERTFATSALAVVLLLALFG